MRTISDIYKEYKIPPNLQLHMFRVASVASLICDNFNEPLSKKDILTACLLHDMGNIIKFDLSYFPEANEPEGIEYWQQIQNEYKKKYGIDEYIANSKIAEELDASERIIELIKSISFLGAPANVLNTDFGTKVVEYADERVTPFGVANLEHRFMDLRKRYTHHGTDTSERRAFENALRQIEEQIFFHCKIKPEDITDETIAPIISELRGFVI